ncbi:hypothetical protein LTR86_004159 [Recurvomyces mirabilis]|nr:hypothetical protein LTR86_004159 [Recurvomyces mirabilis]
MAAAVATNGVQKLAGTKRHADESSLNDDQRFTKRFNLLSIDNHARNGNSNLYIPVSNTGPSTTGTAIALPPGTVPWEHTNGDELMNVDDTRDRVYIHDLDAELADIESEEEKLIFLPDIEKRLSRIPHQVLAGTRSGEDDHHQLVLYSVPKSLTVDEGQDSVRKAIIEARQRARDKAVEEARQEDMMRQYSHENHETATETAHGYSTGYEEEEPDPDAMDLG